MCWLFYELQNCMWNATNMFDVNVIVLLSSHLVERRTKAQKQLKQNNRLSCQRTRNFCGGSWKSQSMIEHFPAFPCCCVSFSRKEMKLFKLVEACERYMRYGFLVFSFLFCHNSTIPFLLCVLFFCACQIWNTVVKNIDSRLLSSVEPTNNIVVAVVCRWWQCMIWASNRQHSMIFQKKSSVVYFWAIALESSLCTLNFIAKVHSLKYSTSAAVKPQNLWF